MEVILIEGNVKYQITLDPGVWIFDDRKVELDTFFETKQLDKSGNDESIKAISEYWDRETTGNLSPPVKNSVKQFEKEKVLKGSFGIPFEPFLKNAEPNSTASKLVIETTKNETYVIPLIEAQRAILGFSKNGQPLKEDGPIHLYYNDGSNKKEPITNIAKLIIK